MIETSQAYHILALGIIPRTTAPKSDVARSLAILFEVLVYCEAFAEAKREGTVDLSAEREELFVLFRGSRVAPVLCALQLSEVLKEFPSMSVRMAIHTGIVSIESGVDGGVTAQGAGIESVRRLLREGEPGEMLLSDMYAESLGRIDGWAGPFGAAEAGSGGTRFQIEPQKVFVLESEGARPAELAAALESALSQDGHKLEDDRTKARDVAWARSVESRIRSADTVIAIVSDFAAGSEMLRYQLEIAVDERRKRGRPQILPIWLTDGPAAGRPLAALHHNLHQAIWDSAGDGTRVVSEVRAALSIGQVETDPPTLEPSGGVVDGSSKSYIRRRADDELEAALDRRRSIVLVKGPRQIGKTSLIGTGIESVQRRGWRCATTDFQNLSSRQLESDDSCYRAIAATIAEQVGFEFDFEEDWLETLGPTRNLDSFVRDLLADSDVPLAWFMDEADRLFFAPYASDFYGIVRSWHNNRATDPRGPWGRLTVVIGYATDAHLFIKDLNQSPFNVGVPVNLDMFSLENTLDLNDRYGKPIGRRADVEALHALIGGQPFLTRRAFDVLARGAMTVDTLLATADLDDGPFGDHLRRILVSVTQLPVVWDALVQSLASPDLPDSEGIQRLISSGILVRRSDRGLELRFELYRRFLARHIAREKESRG